MYRHAPVESRSLQLQKQATMCYDKVGARRPFQRKEIFRAGKRRWRTLAGTAGVLASLVLIFRYSASGKIYDNGPISALQLARLQAHAHARGILERARKTLPSSDLRRGVDTKSAKTAEVGGLWPGAEQHATRALGNHGEFRTMMRVDDRRFDFVSTGTNKGERPSRSFLWSGSNLCVDGASGNFVASAYQRSPGYVPTKFSARFPDRAFINRSLIRSSEVVRWVDGFTLILKNFPMDQPRAHAYFYMTPAMHLVRFALEELHVPPNLLNIVFDDLTIPQHRVMEQQLFEAAFQQISATRRFSRAALPLGLTCFRNVLLHDRLSAPGVVFTMWPADTAYLRKQFMHWSLKPAQKNLLKPNAHTGLSLRDDCTQRPTRTVWIVQRRALSGFRRITNLDSLVASVRKIFGSSWHVAVFDSANTPCAGHGRCLGFPICPPHAHPSEHIPPGRIPVGNCSTTPSILREVEVYNNIDFIISIHGGSLMNALFMPRGAAILEIFPVGIDEYIYRTFSNRADMTYFGFREPNRSAIAKLFPSMPASRCFSDNDCRRAIKQQPVTLTLAALAPVLRRARDAHARRCLRATVAADDGVRMLGKPGLREHHEPKWMFTYDK